MKYQNYESFISKISKEVNPNLQLSGDVVASTNEMVHITLSTIAKCADECNTSFVEKKEKITAKIAGLAATLTFPEGRLGDDLIRKADEAVLKYRDFESAKGSARTTQAHKAGVVVPPSRVRHDLEIDLHTFSQIGEETPVFLAGVLNEFLRKVLKLAGNEALSHKKKRITMRDMRLAIGLEPDFQEFVSNHSIILPGGVMPWIHPSLTPKNM